MKKEQESMDRSKDCTDYDYGNCDKGMRCQENTDPDYRTCKRCLCSICTMAVCIGTKRKAREVK